MKSRILLIGILGALTGLTACSTVDQTTRTSAVGPGIKHVSPAKTSTVKHKAAYAYAVPEIGRVATKKTKRTASLTRRNNPKSYRVSSAPLGHAPYICTPSGFGRRVNCYLR
ncbi:MAG: hypothetical protein H6890_10600 [Brucellaceae bacterium]|nr:hypothetical protein [Brucellaceae bacterium]